MCQKIQDAGNYLINKTLEITQLINNETLYF